MESKKGGEVIQLKVADRVLATAEERGLPILAKVRDTRGKMLTRSLFYETHRTNSQYPYLYSLTEFDKPDAPSARRIYLECLDPTEYSAAIRLLGSWEHWLHLCGLPWFAPIVEEWRAELQERIRSEIMVNARDLMASGSIEPSQRLSAMRLLASLTPKAKNPVGRPIKPPKQKPDITTDVEDDFSRLMNPDVED